MHVARSDDSSSLLPATGLQVEAFPDTVEVAEMVVDVRRLDDLIAVDEVPHPISMKIDVQGAELDVLRGASGLLRRCARSWSSAHSWSSIQGSLCLRTRSFLPASAAIG